MPALAVGQAGMDVAGLGVHQPRLQQLPVAGEQRVRQRAVAPEHAVAVQVHQQAGHGVEQPGAVPGSVRQPHEQAPVLPRPLEVVRDEDRVPLAVRHLSTCTRAAVATVQDQAGGSDRRQTHRLQVAQHRVLLVRDAVRQLLERPQPPVGLDEPDEVPARADGNVPQRDRRRVPLPQRTLPRQREQARRGDPQPHVRGRHRHMVPVIPARCRGRTPWRQAPRGTISPIGPQSSWSIVVLMIFGRAETMSGIRSKKSLRAWVFTW